MRIQSVLHPTDFSMGSETAFVHALSIAVACRARLAVLHADRREPDVCWDDFPAVRRTLERWGMLPAGSGAEAVFDNLGVAVTKIAARDPDPVAAIVRHVEGHRVDLVVLATRGIDGLPRWLTRSVSEPVLERAGVPVLFVSPDSRGFVADVDGGMSLRRVLVPVDVAPSPARALDALDGLLADTGCEPERVRLLHVGSKASAPAIAHQGSGDGEAGWEVSIRGGDVVATILAEAVEHDLTVMTTRGVQGILDVMRGTTTQRVLRRSPCPVLAVPEA